MAEKEKYTKYELARMRGSRALQISAGAPFLVKLSEEQLAELGYDPQRIAQLELDKGVIPLTIRRPMPGEKRKAA